MREIFPPFCQSETFNLKRFKKRSGKPEEMDRTSYTDPSICQNEINSGSVKGRFDRDLAYSLVGPGG